MLESALRILLVNCGAYRVPALDTALRSRGYDCMMLDPHKAATYAESYKVSAIIFSDYPDNFVGLENPKLTELRKQHAHVPTLAIGRSAQMVAAEWEGELGDAQLTPGVTSMHPPGPSPLCNGLNSNRETTLSVWGCSGSPILDLPGCFYVTATFCDEMRGIAAFEHLTQPLYGLQFSPEVRRTSLESRLLENFVEKIAGCKAVVPASI